MDLRRSDLEGLKRLGALWASTPGAEFEAMLTGVDLTSWQDVIQYLRSLGMRENPQIVKMNICLSNDVRITLEGAGVIQAYCRDNRIAGKPFVAMLKEAVAEAEPVTFGSYAVKAKLKREIPLAADDARVKEVIDRWDTLGKHFRNIQRFEFTAPSGVPVRFDVSLVRENAGRPARTFQEAGITGSAPKYEVEVELTASREGTDAEAAVRHLLRGIQWMLQGRQRSYVLVSNQGAGAVRDSLAEIFEGRRSGSNRNRGPAPFRYPGPQPATLEKRHIQTTAEPGIVNMRTLPGGYNVTDKADGLRCLLYVAENGKIFLVDGGGRVYATGKQTKAEYARTVFDGEWIRRDKTGKIMSVFYAFDIFAGPGGDRKVAELPFMIPGAMLGSTAAENTRHAVMARLIAAIAPATQTVRGVPVIQNLEISMKTFRTALGDELFTNAATATLETAASLRYNTDGLIFTPNAAALPMRGTWAEQLKWKPPAENTIDFLVLVEQERSKDGKPTGVEAIGTKYREDTGQTVMYKTLRLFVGSNRDAAFADPRRTILSKEALPKSLDEGEWREVEFRPMEPRDPMASICYVGIGEGAGDPAGAAPAANTLDLNTDIIRSTAGDVIQSNMIVEMAYHPERAPGWRWVPMRVRHDKTERWLAQQMGTGRKGGTMNADWVANSIWTTLHNPVTEEAIKSGIVTQCAAPVTLGPALGYRRAPTRDMVKVQCMRNFHSDVIKRMLLRPVGRGSTLCDLAMGRGEDIPKWIAAEVGRVFGCDAVAANLNDPVDGAYRRLLDKMIALGPESVPPMIFAQADAARSLRTGEAALTEEDRQLLVEEVREPFDTVSCMFAAQYMFRDENTLAGFLNNIADTLKVGGYFVGCGLDGDAVARALGSERAIMGRDGVAEVWSMTKRYGSGIGTTVPPSKAGLGLAVDIDFTVAGELHTSYLMSWPYFLSKLGEVGLDLLNAEELAALGLPGSTAMFGEVWDAAASAGNRYEMTDGIRRYSFLHRWWVLKRRDERRPAPPLEEPAAPVVTELKAATDARAPAPAPAAPTMDVMELPAVPPFIVNGSMKMDPENRLGPELSGWPSYMSLGTLVELSDLTDPTIKYPNMEAALASAKYQRATDKPALGPQLFRVEGAIHQAAEQERAKGGSAELMATSVANEVAKIRVASGLAKMKAYKATWNMDAWTSAREEVYRAYLKQRYEKDAKFAMMIDAIKDQEGEILFVNGTAVNDLGVGQDAGGAILRKEGDNMIGRWMAAL